MNPIKLEIFLDDKTLAGMRSVEGNVANMEAFTRRMIGHLKLELKDLEKEYKNLQKQGLAGARCVLCPPYLHQSCALWFGMRCRRGILQSLRACENRNDSIACRRVPDD